MKKVNAYKKSKLAIASFVLSLIPIIAYILFLLSAIITPADTKLFKIIELIQIILLGFIYLSYYILIASIVLGIVALANIKRDKLTGRGFAIAGVAISVIYGLLTTIYALSTFSYLFDITHALSQSLLS